MGSEGRYFVGQAMAGQTNLMGGGETPTAPAFGLNLPALGYTENPFLSMAAESGAGWLMGQMGLTPGPFLGNQNYMQSLRHRAYRLEQQEAMRRVAPHDFNVGAQLATGLARMTGVPVNDEITGFASKLSPYVSQYMPMLMSTAPSQFDQLMGPSGSMMGLTRGVSETGRTVIDQSTGTYGMTGVNTAEYSRSLYQQMYGPGAGEMASHGIGGSEMGNLMIALQKRGLFSPSSDQVDVARAVRQPGMLRAAIGDDGELARQLRNKVVAGTNTGTTDLTSMAGLQGRSVGQSREQLADVVNQMVDAGSDADIDVMLGRDLHAVEKNTSKGSEYYNIDELKFNKYQELNPDRYTADQYEDVKLSYVKGVLASRGRLTAKMRQDIAGAQSLDALKSIESGPDYDVKSAGGTVDDIVKNATLAEVGGNAAARFKSRMKFAAKSATDQFAAVTGDDAAVGGALRHLERTDPKRFKELSASLFGGDPGKSVDDLAGAIATSPKLLEGGDAPTNERREGESDADYAVRRTKMQVFRDAKKAHIESGKPLASGESAANQIADLEPHLGEVADELEKLKSTDPNKYQQITARLQAGDAKKTLSNIAGAVAAMNEVFTAHGAGGASMDTIVQGVQNLTAGSMGSVSGEKLENMVRTSTTMAEVTGMGIDRYQMAVQQGVGLAASQGMSGKFGTDIANAVSANYGAARNSSARDVANFDKLTPEQAAERGGKLHTQGLNSQAANNLGMLYRMKERFDQTDPSKFSDGLRNLLSAVESGTASAEDMRIFSRPDQFMRMVSSNTDMSMEEVSQQMAFQHGNQVALHGSPERQASIGRMQQTEMIRHNVQRSGGAVGMALLGLGRSREQTQKAMPGVAKNLMEALYGRGEHAMKYGEALDVKTRNKIGGRIIAEHLAVNYDKLTAEKQAEYDRQAGNIYDAADNQSIRSGQGPIATSLATHSEEMLQAKQKQAEVVAAQVKYDKALATLNKPSPMARVAGSLIGAGSGPGIGMLGIATDAVQKLAGAHTEAEIEQKIASLPLPKNEAEQAQYKRAVAMIKKVGDPMSNTPPPEKAPDDAKKGKEGDDAKKGEGDDDAKKGKEGDDTKTASEPLGGKSPDNPLYVKVVELPISKAPIGGTGFS